MEFQKGLNTEHDNQERKNVYHSFYVHKGFISTVSLLNDLMKIFVDLGIFNCVIFKDLESLIVLAKIVFLNNLTNMNWEVSMILLWEILPSVNIIYTENKWRKKIFFPKIMHFCTAKTVANQEKVKSFSDSALSN